MKYIWKKTFWQIFPHFEEILNCSSKTVQLYTYKQVSTHTYIHINIYMCTVNNALVFFIKDEWGS